MQVTKEQVVEAGERDASGLYDYRYCYWLFTFREGDTALVARSYEEEPQQAHFLRKEIGGRAALLKPEDVAGPLFAAACDYLRRIEGKAAIAVLGGQGYIDVLPASPQGGV
jgi:hypothetical protein